MVFIGRWRELGFDDGAGDGDWVVFLDVQASGDGGCYGRREVMPRVRRIGLSVDIY